MEVDHSTQPADDGPEGADQLPNDEPETNQQANDRSETIDEEISFHVDQSFIIPQQIQEE